MLFRERIMAWKTKDGKIIQEGKSWSDGTFNHPYNWASSWSDEDKKKWGLTFTKDADLSFDGRFYWSKGKEKNLNDTDAVDKDGKKIVDENGKQVVELGLKSLWITKTKDRANSKLSITDWYVVRASEDSSLSVPADITAKRKAIRDACKTIEDKILLCSKLADFKKLFDVPMKDGVPTGNPAIIDFPEE
tara:strand:+ start:150 stop:719 length:570 start_codon:yes stop_codon:yes gene_type:complete